MRYSSRFFLYAPFLSFVALATGVMIWWWFAATALNKTLDARNGQEVLPGVKVTFAGKKIAGFPFRLDTILDNVEVDIAASQGPIVWRAEHFASHILTYGPGQIIYEAAGRQEISWRDSEGKLHDFVFVPGTLRASAITSKGALVRFDLDAIEISSPDLGAGRVQFHLRRNPSQDALDLAASADVVRLSPALQAGFGGTLSHLRLEGRLVPGTPLTPLLAGAFDWRRTLDGWRMHGGKFAIDDLSVAWGTLDADARGALALDDQHRLDGTLSVDLAGAASLPPTTSDNAKLAAALIVAASQGAHGANGKFTVPIVFRNGAASVIAIPAGSLGKLY